jgi:choline dehydrogenase-like flavoprotein
MPHFCSAGSTIADALATSRLTLTPNCVVRRVLVDRGGKRAVGVEYVDSVSGRSGEAFGRVVMLCASALESTRIMLNSASKWHPHGLANSSGTLGRYLMDHVLGPRLVGAIERKAAARDVSGMAGLQIPGLGSTGARFVAQGAIELPFDSHGTACVFMGLGEMSPRAENCVSLSDTLTDKWGIPSLRIECAHDDRQQESCLAYLQGLRGLVTAAGYDVVNEGTKPELPGSAVHEMGTARMGSSSRESVLNEYCRTWDVDNLFITDGAAFVTSGFHNPTLTMLALTARACDKIHKDFAAEYV